ncbi:PREDICTED: uncharacterized protein LOC108371013 isoform X1 [Rhagoletis zephyria]|uniref:uncharacterized protein LOC108371013 isoform X1 n=1 Tax=Rhagoletis zephyria TaxID=28612 RepID=UPI000811484A|nr:PREDICTED: uncharacterized protein LOC108371013 isoform X1 [Rhagoletis zephyria]
MDAEFNKKLIKLVKQHECLYDFSAPEYRDQSLKELIWKKIADELNTKDAECKKRWKSLRDTYTKTIRKSHLTTSGKRLPKTKYKYADELSFLRGIKEGKHVWKIVFNRSYSSDEDTYDNEEPNNDDEDLWGPLPSPKMDEDSQSSFCAPSNEATPAIEIEENVKPAFTEVIQKCSDSAVEARGFDPLGAKNSTVMVFESLAHKILSAGLSESDVDAIELKVTSIVYEEIANRRQKRQNKAK